MNAFKGSIAVKQQLVEPIRGPWNSRELLPFGMLKFRDKYNLTSLSGALAQTEDKKEFEERTGIPLELALLCEAMISMGTQLYVTEEAPTVPIQVGSDDVLSFGTQWLDAVTPGVDLSDVVPKYMVELFETMLDREFVMAKYIEPEVREAAVRILQLWKRELAGEDVGNAEWKEARKCAIAASEGIKQAKCLPAARVVEALAWPVRSVSSDFVSVFQGFGMSWMTELQYPFFLEEDRRNQDLIDEGWLLFVRIDQGTYEKTIEEVMAERADIKKAFDSQMDPVIRERKRNARIKASIVTDPVVRGQMAKLLDLIVAA